MFTTDYVRMVQGFMSAEMVREGEATWRMSNYGLLRTVRFDDDNRSPDLRVRRMCSGTGSIRARYTCFSAKRQRA